MADLKAIVRALGGELYAGGRRASVPGPGHGRGDRSLSLRLTADGRLLLHSFAGDDWREVRAELARRGLLAGAPGAAPADAPVPEISYGARLRTARRLWSEARVIAGSVAERHLRGRAVTRPLGDALRCHPGVRAAVYAHRGLERPALLAAVRDASGDLCAVEVTYLAPDGRPARMRTPRKLVGVAPAGCAVRLDPAEDALVVAEGVATALSASSRFGLPAWALLSAGRLQVWSPPPGVRRVLVAADRGAAGERAAGRLAARLRHAGIAVEVSLPPRGAGDWNDLTRAESGAGGGPDR